MIMSQCLGAVRTRKKYIDLNCIYTADPEIRSLAASNFKTGAGVAVSLETAIWRIGGVDNRHTQSSVVKS